MTYVPPQIPTKYEVIPIHNSDRSSFKACRRRWDWSSPARNNLTIRAEIYGVDTNLWFGTGIHYALEAFYSPGLRRDPVEAFKTWFDIQWRGGIVGSEWLDLVYDLKPVPQKVNWELAGDHDDNNETLYKIKGLEDILPDPDTSEFDELRELGIGMLEYYKDYAARNDGFEVVAVEHDFSVPVWDYANNKILTAIDTREQSPNYGKELEVHARGRMDDILQYPTGRLAIMDHKTARAIGEDYFEKLETDEQMTNYLYAAQVEANYYGLEHAGIPFEECIYNVLRKATPSEPTVLANGWFSTNRTTEATTHAILSKWIDNNMPGIPLNEKQQSYVDWLRDLGDEQFIIRAPVRRNQHQIAAAGEQLYLEALDMLGIDGPVRIYKNMTNDWNCKRCAFRTPCIAKDSGADWQDLINNNYSINRDR